MVLYIEPAVTGIYNFSPQLPLFGVGVFTDHLLVISCSATTTYRAGCAALLCQIKNAILFICLPWLFYPLQCVCSLSLSLMACT